MTVSARFEMNRDYFAESFVEWLPSGSRFRKWQLQLAAVAALAGLVVLFAADFPSYVSVGLLMIGVVEGLEFYWYRAKWIGQRTKAREGKTARVEMQFDKSGFTTQGPTSHGHTSWDAIQSILQTPKGLFLRMGDGMSIYVPRASVTPAEAASAIVRWANHDA